MQIPNFIQYFQCQGLCVDAQYVLIVLCNSFRIFKCCVISGHSPEMWLHIYARTRVRLSSKESKAPYESLSLWFSGSNSYTIFSSCKFELLMNFVDYYHCTGTTLKSLCLQCLACALLVITQQGIRDNFLDSVMGTTPEKEPGKFRRALTFALHWCAGPCDEMKNLCDLKKVILKPSSRICND